MEQRAHVFQVSCPRAQLVTCPAWIVLWFSSLILCVLQNGVILEVPSVWMLGTARALVLLSVSTGGAQPLQGSWQGASVLSCFSPLCHHQAEKNRTLVLTFWAVTLWAVSYSWCTFNFYMYFYLVFTYIHIYIHTKSRPHMKHCFGILLTITPTRFSDLVHNYINIFCRTWGRNNNFI